MLIAAYVLTALLLGAYARTVRLAHGPLPPRSALLLYFMPLGRFFDAATDDDGCALDDTSEMKDAWDAVELMVMETLLWASVLCVPLALWHFVPGGEQAAAGIWTALLFTGAVWLFHQHASDPSLLVVAGGLFFVGIGTLLLAVDPASEYADGWIKGSLGLFAALYLAMQAVCAIFAIRLMPPQS